MSSEVAELKERLRLEAEAAFQGLHGYAECARHQIIQHKLEHLFGIGQLLKQHIGDKEATLFLIHLLDQAVENGKDNETNVPQ